MEAVAKAGLRAGKKGAQAVLSAVKGKKDGRYFTSSKRGEVEELKEDLNSSELHRQKTGVKKVIAAMTLGRDVTGLYPHVVKLSSTSNLELKKLVYLYIMATSKLQPEKAVMAVNSFVQDSQNSSHIVRALALRSMLCIRVADLLDYTLQPLLRAFEDKEPYVQKAAALGVLKVFYQSPRAVLDHDLLPALKHLLGAKDASAVAAAAAALSEMAAWADCHGGAVLGTTITSADILGGVCEADIVTNLLAKLPTATEWAQAVILDYVARWCAPEGSSGIQLVLDTVVSRLAHQNAAVSLGALTVVAKWVGFLEEGPSRTAMVSRLGPCLISLISQSTSEALVFLSLRIIALLETAWGKEAVPRSSVKSFFAKHNDSSAVRLEKLSMISSLCDESNAEVVFNELLEYTRELDVPFVRAAVRTVGCCATNVPANASRAAGILGMCVSYGSQQACCVNTAIVVLRDLLQLYPAFAGTLVPQVVSRFDVIDDPEAQAALLHIVGAFPTAAVAEIDDETVTAVDVIKHFHDVMETLPTSGAMALLFCAVRVFLEMPDAAEPTMLAILKQASEQRQSPDLRERALLYWKLMAGDAVHVLPQILNAATGQRAGCDEQLRIATAAALRATPVVSATRLDSYLSDITSPVAILGLSKASYVQSLGLAFVPLEEDSSDEEEEFEAEGFDEADGDGVAMASGGTSPVGLQENKVAPTGSLDLLDIMGAVPPPVAATPAAVTAPVASTTSALDDLFGAAPPAPVPSAFDTLPPVHTAAPYFISASLDASTSSLTLRIGVRNGSQNAISVTSLQFNHNPFGVAPQGVGGIPAPIHGNTAAVGNVPLTFGSTRAASDSLAIPCAVQLNTGQILKFAIPTEWTTFVDRAATASFVADRKNFLSAWKGLTTANERVFDSSAAVNTFRAALTAGGFAAVHERVAGDKQVVYSACVVRDAGSSVVLVESIFAASGTSPTRVTIRSATSELVRIDLSLLLSRSSSRILSYPLVSLS